MRIGIIGIGNLGNAMANLLCRNGYEKSLMLSELKNSEIYIYDNNNNMERKQFKNFSNEEIIEKADILFLCVKPDNLDNIITYINLCKIRNMFPSELYSPDKIIISCVSGIDIQSLESKLKTKHPIIRCMPNLPISLGKGAICFTNNKWVSDHLIGEFYSICKGPLIHKVKKESLIDASTILTSSMPAFISFFSEEFIEFGCSKGFTYIESRDLFLSTLIGTMEMLKTSSTDEIIEAVSSPSSSKINDYTERGVNFFQYSGIRSIIYTALNESYNSIRSKH